MIRTKLTNLVSLQNDWLSESNLVQIDSVKNVPEALRVIIVDDRASVRESLRTALTLEDDIEVVGEADNGRTAVEITQDLRPNAVLMDFEMPDAAGQNFDGIEACREIKQRQLAHVVIVLTIHADQHSRQRAYSAGCDLFLEKGIGTDELLTHLRRLTG